MLFSDGEYLIAYNSGFRPMYRRQFVTDDEKNVAMVTTNPNFDEDVWEPMEIGELVVLTHGVIIDERVISGCPPELGGVPRDEAR